MKNIYTIGELKPLQPDQIGEIKQMVSFALPSDYIDILQMYGYGDINEFLMLNIPDEHYLNNNFKDYLDLWDWKSESDKTIALSGLMICLTIDGDIVLCVESSYPYWLLPRHSNEIKQFEKLEDILNLFFRDQEDIYFDPYYDKKMEYISLIKNDDLDKELIGKIHRTFLEKYTPDKAFNIGVQPKYILQTIGGWVYFDLAYKSAIRVSYQLKYEGKAIEVINFIKGFVG